jgi:tRNA(adenine34) deaminase
MGIIIQEQDVLWLQQALSLAKKAASENEVPIGALVVLNGQIIGQGYNRSIQANDPTAHAEIVALREAAKNMGNYRLIDTTLYVTLEPCPMCAGSLLHARVKRLVFGAFDQKAGAIISRMQLLDNIFNHKVHWQGGILASECAGLIQDFFKVRR